MFLPLLFKNIAAYIFIIKDELSKEHCIKHQAAKEVADPELPEKR